MKIYTALISQSGTSAPTVIVLENTIGSIVWTRSSQGYYFGTLTGAFPAGKTTMLLGNNGWVDIFIAGGWAGVDGVWIATGGYNSGSIDQMDNVLGRTTVEIRVYQ